MSVSPMVVPFLKCTITSNQAIVYKDSHVQVIAVSSAATVFSYMRDVPPLTLAAWRLQLTALLLCPGAVYQYRTLTAGINQPFYKVSGMGEPALH